MKKQFDLSAAALHILAMAFMLLDTCGRRFFFRRSG